MAALTLSDELSEARHRVQKLASDLSAMHDARAASAGHNQATQAAVAAALNAAAERIERVTRGLNQGVGDGVAIG
jgi:cell division protein ZapA